MLPTDRYVSETTFHVRYAETDAMRIVHHSSYIVYFEEGRSAYTRDRGQDYANFERNGLFLAVTEVNARYIKPATYGQRLTICTWIENVKSRGIEFAYLIVDADTREKHVEGRTRHVCVDREGRVRHIPDEWRVWAVDHKSQ
ncbi:MAG TPA: thioesterase family protein [Aggregatilineales bacterium]|jgi:acyl-CoA thioester hydrolase|nr:thioesterase family protein [Aggregatilineales bacterium]